MILNLGYNNCVMVDKVVAIITSDSKPARRLRETAEKNARLIDATNGRKTRSIVITSSNHVILSSLHPETLIQRLNEIQK
jgi:hypothetical protein